MTSILTNSAATIALQTLRSLSHSLSEIQDQVSTGLRVGRASDNAAYWSISTTMRSDGAAISAVSDALGLGAAKVDTAYAGLESVVDVLSEVKAKIVAAQEEGVDKAKIQAELEQLKAQIVSIAQSASFGGQNWLQTDIQNIRDNAANSRSVVSGFVRDRQSDVSVSTIDVDLSRISLFNSTGRGLLQADISTGGAGSGGAANPATYHVQEYLSFTGPITLSPADSISFDLIVHPGGGTPAVVTPTTITRADIDAALPAAGGTIADGSEMASVLNKVWPGSGLGGGAYGQVQPDGTTNWHTFVIHAHNVTDQPDSDIEIANLTSTLPGGVSGGLDGASYYTARSAFPGGGSGGTPAEEPTLWVGLLDIDVTQGQGAQLDAVEVMLGRVTAAASLLGSMKMRIDMQSDFASRLLQSVDQGIGRLVDTDMNEASTRLKALETQRQLSIQSLTIANSNAEQILKLFA